MLNWVQMSVRKSHAFPALYNLASSSTFGIAWIHCVSHQSQVFFLLFRHFSHHLIDLMIPEFFTRQFFENNTYHKNLFHSFRVGVCWYTTSDYYQLYTASDPVAKSIYVVIDHVTILLTLWFENCTICIQCG